MDISEAMSEVVAYLGGEPKPRFNWTSIRCVSPEHEDLHRSARINYELGAFRCLACDLKAGSPIQLLQRALDLDYEAADALYKKITKGRGPGTRKKKSDAVGFNTDGTPRSYEKGQGFARWLRK